MCRIERRRAHLLVQQRRRCIACCRMSLAVVASRRAFVQTKCVQFRGQAWPAFEHIWSMPAEVCSTWALFRCVWPRIFQGRSSAQRRGWSFGRARGGQLQGVPVQGWTWGRSLTKGPGIKHLSASKASVALSSGEATSPRLGRACLGPRLVVGVVGVATDLFVRQGRASAVEPPMTGSIQEIGPKNVLTHQPAGPRFEPQ